MVERKEEKIIARGLGQRGVLLLVKKQLESLDVTNIRIIVTDEASKDGLIEYFSARGCKCETDRAGGDIHVIVDLAGCKEV